MSETFQKRQKLENDNTELTSQEIYDILCTLDLKWTYSDRNYIETLKQMSEKQANNGDLLSLNNLGFILMKDYKFQEAEQIFLRAAELGNIEAIHNLGCLCYENNRIEDSEGLLLRSANLGFSKSMNCLGFLYEHKLDNYKKAEEWYNKAIELGNKYAMNNLLNMYNTKIKDLSNKADMLKNNIKNTQ
jgi:TPR repeat protein